MTVQQLREQRVVEWHVRIMTTLHHFYLVQQQIGAVTSCQMISLSLSLHVIEINRNLILLNFSLSWVEDTIYHSHMVHLWTDPAGWAVHFQLTWKGGIAGSSLLSGKCTPVSGIFWIFWEGNYKMRCMASPWAEAEQIMLKTTICLDSWTNMQNGGLRLHSVFERGGKQYHLQILGVASC